MVRFVFFSVKKILILARVIEEKACFFLFTGL